MAQQPVNAPSQSTPDNQRRNQFGRKTPGDPQLGRRRTHGPDRATLLGFVEPLAQLAQFVGILSHAHHPQAEKRAKNRPSRRVEGGGTIRRGIPKCQERQIRLNPLLYLRKTPPRIMSREIFCAAPNEGYSAATFSASASVTETSWLMPRSAM